MAVKRLWRSEKARRWGFRVWLAVFTLATAWAVQQGLEAHNALCVVRAGLQRDVVRTDAFIKKHPEGIPGLVTADELALSNDDQRERVRDLRGLDC